MYYHYYLTNDPGSKPNQGKVSVIFEKEKARLLAMSTKTVEEIKQRTIVMEALQGEAPGRN